MHLEQDYLIYAIEVTLTFLAVSSTYLINVTKPITFLAIIPSTILFGYTAYVSRERFRPQSAISMLALVLIPVGGIVALGAVFITLVNFLTSIFANGSAFKDYYSSISLPLLFSGLLMSSLLFGMTAINPTFANTVRDEVAGFTGTQAEQIMDRSNMMKSQKGSQKVLVNRTSDSTFRITKNYVLGVMGRNSDLNNRQYTDLQNAFENADKAVDRGLKREATMNLDEAEVDIQSRVSDLVRNSLKGKSFLMIVPIVTLAIYGIHPVVGVLTAIWASIFSLGNTWLKERTNTKDLDNQLKL
jgi:hypothetical protein